MIEKVFWALLFFPLSSFSFTLPVEGESRFVDPEVSIDVSSGDCGGVGMTPQEVLDFAKEAVDKYWNRIPHCSLELLGGRVVDVDVLNIDINDPLQQMAVIDEVGSNRILVACNQGTFGAENGATLGAGLIANNRGLVFINSSEGNLFRRISREERLAVFAHEIGHAFGLGHSADPVALMYYDISGKIQKKLSADDFDGCAYLYPHDFPGNCSMAPYVKDRGVSAGGGGGVRQTMLVGLLLGFVLVAMFGRMGGRPWRG